MTPLWSARSASTPRFWFWEMPGGRSVEQLAQRALDGVDGEDELVGDLPVGRRSGVAASLGSGRQSAMRTRRCAGSGRRRGARAGRSGSAVHGGVAGVSRRSASRRSRPTSPSRSRRRPVHALAVDARAVVGEALVATAPSSSPRRSSSACNRDTSASQLDAMSLVDRRPIVRRRRFSLSSTMTCRPSPSR